MTGSPSKLHQWFDRDFQELGAFLTSSDGEIVYLAKGGETSFVESFLKTDEPVFYLKDFSKNSYLAYRPGLYLALPRKELEAFISCWSFNPSEYGSVRIEEDLYQRDFERLKNSFNENLQKVVLISRETYQGPIFLNRFVKKAMSFGTGRPYGFWNEEYGIIGSTPEGLFSVQNGKLKTLALAGTARFGEEKKLLSSQKDRHEHELVIRNITEKLKEFCTHIKVGETGIRPFKKIIHLQTAIDADLNAGTDLTKLTSELSPTAALGGYPKEEALNFLNASEYAKKFPKRYFGSCFGLVTKDIQDFIVAIRNIQWNKNEVFIESGGGIVAQSELSKEIEELRLKRETIREHYL
jgi:isochorismate synthase EntC